MINQSSDLRLKTDVNPLTNDIISQIEPKSFKLKSDPTRQRYGFIAQEMQTVAPELVHSDGSGMLSINYIDIIAQLVRHIQKQDERIAKLEAALEARLIN